jgi:hypothetical protein
MPASLEVAVAMAVIMLKIKEGRGPQFSPVRPPDLKIVPARSPHSFRLDITSQAYSGLSQIAGYSNSNMSYGVVCLLPLLGSTVNHRLSS